MNKLNKAFSSPFRGFYLSTLSLAVRLRRSSSRPLFGVSIFLLIMRTIERFGDCSRPLFGVSIFLRGISDCYVWRIGVLVPFSGFLSFYCYSCWKQGSLSFSSPFRGFYLSTSCIERTEQEGRVLVPFSGFLSFYRHCKWSVQRLSRSRPLFGVSIFLPLLKNIITEGVVFSSPFRGFYLSTFTPDNYEKYSNRSRPLFGVSIFLPFPLHPLLFLYL